MRSLFSTSVPAVFFCFPWWNDHWLRQVNHACGGGLKYLGANSGVDGVSSCVLSKLGLFLIFGGDEQGETCGEGNTVDGSEIR